MFLTSMRKGWFAGAGRSILLPAPGISLRVSFPAPTPAIPSLNGFDLDRQLEGYTEATLVAARPPWAAKAGIDDDTIPTMMPRLGAAICSVSMIIDIEGSRATHAEAQRLFGLLGQPQAMAIAEHDLEHGFAQPLRESAATWMARWLQGREERFQEAPTEVLPRGELQCTESGNVLELKGRSVMDLVVAEADGLAARRKKEARSREALLGDVRRLLALSETMPAPTVLEVGREARDGVVRIRLRFETEPGVTVPATLLEPADGPSTALRAGGTTNGFVVIVSEAGQAGLAQPNGKGEEQVRKGRRVLIPDLRGWGETWPRARLDRSWPKWFGEDWQEAQLSLMLDRPLLGQRVFDLLSVLGWVREESGSRGVDVHGLGAAIPVALHAAALDAGVAALRLDRPLVSWNAMLKARPPTVHLADAVPGALKVYDLPDLVEAMKPRSVYGLTEQSI